VTQQPIRVRYRRDPSLDPQLVWTGKEALDSEDLTADAPAIYIQERVDPRVIVANLRRTAARGEDEPGPALFDSDEAGPGAPDLVDFYRHQASWSNRLILGDSLGVMASLAEREGLRGQVQVIYVDPPYGIKFGSNWQVSARNRDVKDGKIEDVSREAEQIRAFRDTWELGIHSYLTYLRDRLAVARDLLAGTGSVFVQIGDENVHLVRSLLDEVFGSENFCSQIVYQKAPYATSVLLPPVFDTVLWYAKDRDRVKYRQLFRARTAEEVANTYSYRDEHGEQFQSVSLISPGPASSDQGFYFRGKKYLPAAGSHWKTTLDGLARAAHAGRLFAARNSLRFKSYPADFPVAIRHNIWTDTITGSFTEAKLFVVQTTPKVIERCVLMSSDPGDLVLDPTCGSGTTAFVAEQWGRRWITIDTSRVALALARLRLMGARFPWYLLADSAEGRAKEAGLSGRTWPRAQTANDIRHGFVCERAQHITLKSIAGNPDITEGMSREEIEAAIRRHAEFEPLHDKPYEDRGRVRVSGPFTVESTSPHRSLAFAGSAVYGAGALNTGEAGPGSRDGGSFEQMILANLRTAGIQNGRKGERLRFDTVQPYGAARIQAVGEREGAADGTPRRVGITIGPEYGTVGPAFIKDAAGEASLAADLDLLCVLAFAFDPSVLDAGDDYVVSAEGFANVAAERGLGRVPVLLVRMNADLVMGEELKKTGAGNLFTAFGEPDIEIVDEGSQLRVILHGVDVYDPNTGQVRSNDTAQIALWMIDTAYDGESFFVRHCYFTGGQDPYARLRRALRADIDEGAWQSLYRTESLPFSRPDTGKIAVKVINDYGDEVMKVFTV
jgi:adenine-specific DNA-methyltransferase